MEIFQRRLRRTPAHINGESLRANVVLRSSSAIVLGIDIGLWDGVTENDDVAGVG